VEFYIDGKLRANISTQPYTYTWKRERFRIRILKHIHKITVTAYDKAGNSNSDEIKVWKLL